jgi:hypothetical protein
MHSTDEIRANALAWLEALAKHQIKPTDHDNASVFVPIWVIKAVTRPIPPRTEIKQLTESRNRYKRLYHELLDKQARLDNEGVPVVDTTTVRLYKHGRWDHAFTTYLKKEGDRFRVTRSALGKATRGTFHMAARRFGFTVRITQLATGDIIVRRYS